MIKTNVDEITGRFCRIREEQSTHSSNFLHFDPPTSYLIRFNGWSCHVSFIFCQMQREWMAYIVLQCFILREHMFVDFPTQASNNITQTL